MMAVELEKQILGESMELQRVEMLEDISDALLEMTQQCQRRLDIFSHTLDRRIYNSEALYQAVLKLATRSRYSQIRIIIKDTTNVVKHGNRLVTLAQRVSSRMEFRTPPVEYRDHPEEFAIIDGTGIVYRPIATRYEADIAFHAPLKAGQLNKFFEECWRKSGPDPNLRRLAI